MNIPFSPPDIGEEEIREVVKTLRSGWITTGPKTKEFERNIAEYCGVKKAVCLNSATACLEMALRLLEIGSEDEVITSSYTYSASASVIAHVGAKVILIDVAPDSYEMDLQQLENSINENTKAIISVDIAGVMCDYDRIKEIALRKKDIFKPSNKLQESIGRIAIIADGAHALGASRNGVRCGQAADFTSFSFHAVKNLTTAEGGALVWNEIAGIDSDELYKQLMLFSLHGQSKDALAKTQLGAWEYDIVAPYYKCNMTDVIAAIGLGQLKRYPGLLARRKEIIERYNMELSELPVTVLQHYGDNFASSGHLYLVRVVEKNRQECNNIILKMAEKGVATNVHYKPLPMLTAYKNMGYNIEDFPNAYAMFENEITLPLHTRLTDEQIEYVIEVLKESI